MAVLDPTKPVVADNSAFGGGPNAAQAANANAALGITPPPATGTIDVSKIGTVPAFTLPPAPATPNYATTLGAIPSIASIVGQEGTKTAAEATNDTLGTQLLADQKKLIGKSAAQSAAETAAGLPGFQTQLTDANNRIQALQKEALAIPLQDQQDATGRGITAAGLAPIETAKLRQNTIEALQQSAIAQTMQGNITLAQAQADKAVKAQFDPVQAEIDYIQKAIDLNKPNMTKEEKTQADLVQAQLTDRQTQLDQAKVDKTTIVSMAAAAVKNNPGNQAVQLAANKALQTNDLATAFSLIGQYQSDPVATQQALADLAYTRAQTKKLNADAQAVAPGTPQITNPDAAKYQTALNVILGSQNFTKDQKASVVNAVNNGQDPFTVIKNQAKNIMGQTEATKLTSYEAADNAMKDIQTTMSQFYAAGGNTGLLKGTMEQTINNLGNVTDPKLVEISTQVALSLQAYRNAISGTAYSDQEGKDIASVFPGINKSQGLNTAVITGRLKADQSLIDGIYRPVLGSTYDDLKKANAPAALPANNDPYASYRSQLQPGEILVLRNGQPYAISKAEFNSKTDKLPAGGMDSI